MKVYELFFECLKLILKGKGKYECRYCTGTGERTINGFLCLDTEQAIFWQGETE